jgi:hypothetical protein
MYKIPKTFFDDCIQCCDVPIPEVIKQTKNHYFIAETEDEKMHELRDRAQLYAQDTLAYWESYRGLVLSARATLKIIGWGENRYGN